MTAGMMLGSLSKVDAAAVVSGTKGSGPAAVEFEAVFLSRLLQVMTEGLGADALLTKEPFGSMLVDEYAKLISRSGGIGIADMVKRELLRIQENG